MTSELLAVIEGVVMGRVIEQTKGGGTLSFQYEHSWLALNQAFQLSVSMPLSEAPYKHRVIRPFLLNLLPENQAVLRRWEMEFHVSANNPFRLLQHVGEDCPGAAQFVRPERLAEYQDPGPPKIQWLTTKEITERMGRLREDFAAFRSGVMIRMLATNGRGFARRQWYLYRNDIQTIEVVIVIPFDTATAMFMWVVESLTNRLRRFEENIHSSRNALTGLARAIR